MLPLRYRRGWRVAGLMVLALAFTGFVLPALDLWPGISLRRLFAFDKWLHAGMFLFLTVWFSGQYGRRAYWRIALGLLVFGAAIELIQRTLTYRSGDLADLIANMIGIGAGLCIAAAGAGGWSLRVERWLNSEPIREG